MKTFDSRADGILALRHENYEASGVSLSSRACIVGTEIAERMTGGQGIGLYAYHEEPRVGDLNCANYWRPSDRECGGWAFAWPSLSIRPPKRNAGGVRMPYWTNQQPGENAEARLMKSNTDTTDRGEMGPLLVKPQYELDVDGRWEEKQIETPHESDERLWPKFPVGYWGVVMAGVREDKQVDVFHPTDPRLFAINRAGDPYCGSLVCDTNKDFEIDADRTAPLQAWWRVVRYPDGCAHIATEKNLLAWNLGRSGLGDCVGGAIFNRTGTRAGIVGMASRALGGPLCCGRQDDIHRICEDGDGNPMNSLHLSTDALWSTAGAEFASPCDAAPVPYDGPLEFEKEKYEGVKTGTNRMRVHLVYDEDKKYKHITGEKKGVWRWYAESNFVTEEQPCRKQFTPSRADVNPRQGGRGFTYSGSSVSSSDLTDVATGPGTMPPIELPPIAPNVTYTPDVSKAPGDAGYWGGPTQQSTPGEGGGPGLSVNATCLETQFPASSFTAAQPTMTGLPDVSHDSRPGVEVLADARSEWPTVAREVGFCQQGRTNPGPYGSKKRDEAVKKTHKPCDGYGGGGTADGGIVTLPPELVIRDLLSSVSDTDADRPEYTTGVLASIVYRIASPGVNYGCGVPHLDTGSMRSGYSWRVRNNTLQFSYHDDDAVKTQAVRFDTDKNIGWMSGGSYWATLKHAASSTREYTFPNYDGFVTLNCFGENFPPWTMPNTATGLIPAGHIPFGETAGHGRLDCDPAIRLTFPTVYTAMLTLGRDSNGATGQDPYKGYLQFKLYTGGMTPVLHDCKISMGNATENMEYFLPTSQPRMGSPYASYALVVDLSGQLSWTAVGTLAPSAGSYVTIAAEAGLSAERVLTGTANQITVTDNGANSTVVLSTPQDIATASSPQFLKLGLGVAVSANSILNITGNCGSLPQATGDVGLININQNGIRLKDTYSGAGILCDPWFSGDAGGKTHPWIMSAYLNPPHITKNGATVNKAATLYLSGAPTDGEDDYGNENYALYSASGYNYLGGYVRSPVVISVSSLVTAQNGYDTIGYANFLIRPDGGQTIADGYSAVGMQVYPWFTSAGGYTHSLVASGYFMPPGITGSPTVTTACTLYVTDEPTIGSANYALYVAAGKSYFGGYVSSPVVISVSSLVTAQNGYDTIGYANFLIRPDGGQTIANGYSAVGAQIYPWFTSTGGYTHPLIASAYFMPPGISNSPTVTAAYTLHVTDEPTIGSTNYALYVAAGKTYFGGTLQATRIGVGVAPDAARSIAIAESMTMPATTSATTGIIFKGTDRFIHDFTLAGTTGNNVFIGLLAGNFTLTGSTGTQGSYLTAVGYGALNSVTTGFSDTACGRYALFSCTTGTLNSAFGDRALYTMLVGYYNVAIGANSLFYATGIGNSAVGVSSGGSITTGTNSTFLGLEAGNNASQKVDATNSMALGYGSYTTQSNQIILGNASITTVGIGTFAPGAMLDVLKTTEQLRLSYSAAVYTSITTNSSGYLFLAPTGKKVAINNALTPVGILDTCGVAGSGTQEIVLSLNKRTEADRSWRFMAGYNADTQWGAYSLRIYPYSSGSTGDFVIGTGGGHFHLGTGSPDTADALTHFTELLRVTSTSEQCRLLYSQTYYATFVVSSTGGLTIAPSHLGVNMGSTVLAAAANDLAAGTTGAGQLFYDQSASTLFIYDASAAQQHKLNASGTVIFNETGADTDFRIEGVGSANLFYLDSSAAMIGIGMPNPEVLLHLEKGITLTDDLSDGYASAFLTRPNYAADSSKTVTRHNYITIADPEVANVIITDCCVLRFDAGAGTHHALGAASTKTTPGGVDAWVKINVNGTVMYMPAYASKTA